MTQVLLCPAFLSLSTSLVHYFPLILVPRRINIDLCSNLINVVSSTSAHTHMTGGLLLVHVSTSYLLYCILCHVFIYIVCHYINQCISKAEKEQKHAKDGKKNKKKNSKVVKDQDMSNSSYKGLLRI